MPPFNINKFRENARATMRAWHPPPPGLSLPQPPPMVIEENANAGNNLLASISLERQSGLPAAAAPFVPAAASTLNPFVAPYVSAAASTLNPHVAPYVPAAVLQEKAEVNALLREAANQRSGGKRRRYRKSRKTRKARKTRKSKKSRRTYK